MTTLCWVRHGETDWNAGHRLQGRQDVPLNARGRVQAARVGEYLALGTWNAVVTSPLSRALETARMISERLDLGEPAPMVELVERDYGSASGLTPGERLARFGEAPIPDAEPIDALRDRVSLALDTLERWHQGGRVIVVAHGGTINAMLAILSDGQIGTGKTVLSNASLSLIQEINGAGRWEIAFYNQSVPGL